MATVKEITHDSSTTIGDFYGTVTDTDGAITVSTAAALNLSVNGVNMDFDAGANSAILIETFSFSSSDLRWRFRIKLDNLTNNNSGSVFCEMAIEADDVSNIFQILIAGNGGDSGFNIIAKYAEDGKGHPLVQIGSGSDAIPSTGEVCIELRAIAETGAASADGEAELFIDQVSVQSISNAENNNVFTGINRMRAEFDSSDADITGDMDYDEWILDDDNTITTLCDDVVATHIWLSTDGGTTYTDIGDTAWLTNVVGGVVVVPGTAYQTIFAAVGTDLYKTTDGGTAWSLETAIGYEVDFIDLEKDNTTVFLAKRDAAGANRASLWDSVGASLTHINTGKSTTGGATSGGDVV